jgi:hypothetical protein
MVENGPVVLESVPSRETRYPVTGVPPGEAGEDHVIVADFAISSFETLID